MRDDPLFILGPPRVGSTLLVAMLDGHPDVVLTNETRVLTYAWRTLNPKPWAPAGHRQVFLDATRAALKDAIEAGYRSLGGDGRWWGDKFPHYADPADGGLRDMALAWWPESKWLALTRNPADVVQSIYTRGDRRSIEEARQVEASHRRCALAWIDRDDVDGIHVDYDDVVGAAAAATVEDVLRWWGPGPWPRMVDHVADALGTRWSDPTSW